MNKNWKKVKLESVCDFQNGFAFKSKLFKKVGTPLLRISNIQNNEIDNEGLVCVDPSDYKQDLSTYIVKEGDLLIAMSGATTGKLGINKNSDIFYQNQRVGRFIPNSELNKSYLFYFLLTKVKENLAISVGSAQPNLSTGQIKDFDIPLPLIDEQKRIVDKIEELFSIINDSLETVDEIPNSLEFYKKAILNEAFKAGKGWNKKKLGDIAHTITKGSTPTTYGYQYKNRGINFVKVENIENTRVDVDGISKYIDNNAHKFLKRSQLEANDILFSIAGTIGKIAFIDETILPANTNQALAIIRGYADTLEPKYLLYLLQSQIALGAIQKARGGAMNNISLGDLKSLTIPFPEKEKQIEIITSIEEKFSVVNANYQTIFDGKKKINTLKQSVLNKAFSGELLN